MLQQVLQNIKSITISIAKSWKYCNKNCIISKVLQYLLQNLKALQYVLQNLKSIAILCNTIGTTPASSKRYLDLLSIVCLPLKIKFCSYFILPFVKSPQFYVKTYFLSLSHIQNIFFFPNKLCIISLFLEHKEFLLTIRVRIGGP